MKSEVRMYPTECLDKMHAFQTACAALIDHLGPGPHPPMLQVKVAACMRTLYVLDEAVQRYARQSEQER